MATDTWKKLISRQRRSLILAVFAAVVFVWSAVYIFDVDISLMYEILLMSVLLLSVVVFLAFIFSIALSLLKNRNSE